MTVYYLKSTDRETLWLALESAGLAERKHDPFDENNQEPEEFDADWVPSGEFEWVVKDCELDEIGTMYVETGDTQLVDDVEMPVTEAVEGYHANLLTSLTAAQKELLPLVQQPPKTPKRKWLGVE